MKDMNTVISWGLVIMGIISIIGWVLLSYMAGASVGTEIPIGIISGLVGVLTGKGLAEKQNQPLQQSHTAQTMGQVANVASQGQAIVNAIDNIQETLKPKK